MSGDRGLDLPANIVLAFTEPRAVGEVLLDGKYRYRITRQIGREEFMEQLLANSCKDDHVAVESEMKEARITGRRRHSLQPGDEFTCFYRAECV